MLTLPGHSRYAYSPIVKRPDYSWPGGKRLAFYVALNIEHFAFGAGLGMDPVRDGPRIRARLGVVPQLDTLDNELTVRENLVIYARYFGISRRDARVRADRAVDLDAAPQRVEWRGQRAVGRDVQQFRDQPQRDRLCQLLDQFAAASRQQVLHHRLSQRADPAFQFRHVLRREHPAHHSPQPGMRRTIGCQQC